jgi:outer membrane beta-barrel protein
MERRDSIFLLSGRIVTAFTLVLLAMHNAIAADENPAEPAASGAGVVQQPPIIEPQVKRREVKPPDIDTENFEVGPFVGFMSVEDFGTDLLYGARLNYHFSEDFFLEGSIGQTTVGETSFERLSGGIRLLTDSQRDLTFYAISIGYNIFPGEAFVGRDTSFNTALYLIGGVGNTEFAGDNRFTVIAGAGYRLLVNDWMAVHANVRDYLFKIDVTGEDKTTHNIELSLGLTFYF